LLVLTTHSFKQHRTTMPSKAFLAAIAKDNERFERFFQIAWKQGGGR
jgi:hypothetical protein